MTATAPPAAITPAAITPAGRPQGAISSIDTIELVVAPGGAVSAPGGESGAAGCQPQDFSAGDVVRLTTGSGAVVHEAVLPACHLEVISAPGTGIAVSAPRFSLTLPAIAWKEGDAWILHIGARSWPLTAATLSEHSWSITVSADEGVSAGRLD